MPVSHIDSVDMVCSPNYCGLTLPLCLPRAFTQANRILYRFFPYVTIAPSRFGFTRLDGVPVAGFPLQWHSAAVSIAVVVSMSGGMSMLDGRESALS